MIPKFIIDREFYKNLAIYFFVASIGAAAFQGGGLSLATLFENHPTSMHKWKNDFQQYYWIQYGFIWFFILSILKYIFYSMSIVSIYFYLLESKEILSKLRIILSFKYIKILISIVVIGTLPCLIISIMQYQWVMLLVGIKALLPLLSLFIGFFLSRNDFKRICSSLDFALFACLIISILQLIQGYQYCDGICVRTTGTFIEPNTLATFALARFMLFHLNRDINYLYLIIISGSIIFLSGSRTIGLVFLLSMIMFININIKKNILFLSSGIILFIYSLVNGRGLESIILRLKNFKDIDSHALIFGSGFGSGTQSSHLYAKVTVDGATNLLQGDMQILSFINQGGLWMMLSLIVATVMMINVGNRRSLIFLFMIFWVAGLGLVILEVWPINILIFMCIGFSLREENVFKPHYQTNS